MKSKDAKCIYIWLITLSVIVLLNIIGFCVLCTEDSLSLDFSGLLVGILAILVTVLIGWNIYRVLDEDRISKIEISMQEKFREAMVHVHYNSYIAFKAQNAVAGSITSLVQTLDFLFQNVDEEYENIERNCGYLEEELKRIPNSFGETNCKILRKGLSKIEKSEAFKTGLDKETKQKLETAFNTIRQRIKS